jgi:hypothetical protein
MSRRSPPKQLWYHDAVLFLAPAALSVESKKWVKEKVKAKEGNESHDRLVSMSLFFVSLNL